MYILKWDIAIGFNEESSGSRRTLWDISFFSVIIIFIRKLEGQWSAVNLDECNKVHLVKLYQCFQNNASKNVNCQLSRREVFCDEYQMYVALLSLNTLKSNCTTFYFWVVQLSDILLSVVLIAKSNEKYNPSNYRLWP